MNVSWCCRNHCWFTFVSLCCGVGIVQCQFRTSSLRPLLRMLAWRDAVSRPLVKGNEDAGYEGGSVSFQSFVLRHLVISPTHNAKYSLETIWSLLV